MSFKSAIFDKQLPFTVIAANNKSGTFLNKKIPPPPRSLQQKDSHNSFSYSLNVFYSHNSLIFWLIKHALNLSDVFLE